MERISSFGKKELKDSFWKSYDVWRRTENQAIRYRCFQNVRTGLFSVQSADFYQLPLNHENICRHDNQFIEYFLEEAPDDRSGSFNSLEEAIQAHDDEFENSK